jgi:hypothetical protein
LRQKSAFLQLKAFAPKSPCFLECLSSSLYVESTGRGEMR